jgi:uncharacterized membrane protein required for colicin V production
MLLDAVALGTLLLFAALGARRGALVSGVSLFVLFGSYGTGVLAALHWGPGAAELLGLPPYLGAPAAGSTAFLVAFALGSLGSWVLRTWDAGRHARRGRSGRDRIGGACFGALRGALVVLLIGLLAVWLDAWRSLEAGADPAVPTTTPLRTVTQHVVEAGAGVALADAGRGGAIAAHTLARPAETLSGMRALVEDPRIGALADDRLFWSYVEQGAYDAALNRERFRAIAGDPSLRDGLAALGLVSSASASDPAVFRIEAEQVLAEVGPRVQRLRNDPELQRLARDPEIVARLERGDVFGLLRHPGLQRVVSLVLAEESERG